MPRSECVLLLVDAINPLDFDGAEAMRPAALQAAREVAAMKSRLAAAGVRSVYANDHDGRWSPGIEPVLERCRHAGGEAAAIAALLAPQPGDLTLIKPRHSAFHATPLPLLLEELKAKRLVIVGFAADICVQFSAADAWMRGLAVWVPRDGTAAQSADRQARAIGFVADVLGGRTGPCAQVRAEAAAWQLPKRGTNKESADV